MTPLTIDDIKQLPEPTIQKLAEQAAQWLRAHKEGGHGFIVSSRKLGRISWQWRWRGMGAPSCCIDIELIETCFTLGYKIATTDDRPTTLTLHPSSDQTFCPLGTPPPTVVHGVDGAEYGLPVGEEQKEKMEKL